METAKTIHRQLMTDKNLMWGMAAREFVGAPNSLRFKVSGAKHKGYVRIIYDAGSDTYTVEMAKIRRYEWIVKASVSGVFCDMLHGILERHVY